MCVGGTEGSEIVGDPPPIKVSDYGTSHKFHPEIKHSFFWLQLFLSFFTNTLHLCNDWVKLHIKNKPLPRF
jgi:hypothetical protein